MKVLQFTKIKPTEGLLFKRQANDVTIGPDSIQVSTFPYFIYSGNYPIKSIVKDTGSHVIYLVEHEELYGDWYIYVSKVNKKIMLYNDSKEGVILK